MTNCLVMGIVPTFLNFRTFSYTIEEHNRTICFIDLATPNIIFHDIGRVKLYNIAYILKIIHISPCNKQMVIHVGVVFWTTSETT